MTAQSGIAFQHTDGSSGKHYIAETVTSGLALFDYDGDGLDEILFGTPFNNNDAGTIYVFTNVSGDVDGDRDVDLA